MRHCPVGTCYLQAGRRSIQYQAIIQDGVIVPVRSSPRFPQLDLRPERLLSHSQSPSGVHYSRMFHYQTIGAALFGTCNMTRGSDSFLNALPRLRCCVVLFGDSTPKSSSNFRSVLLVQCRLFESDGEEKNKEVTYSGTTCLICGFTYPSTAFAARERHWLRNGYFNWTVPSMYGAYSTSF